MDDLHLIENRIAAEIFDAAFTMHKMLGPGLLESIYERVFEYELLSRSFQVERQLPIKVGYKTLTFDEGFRSDLVINFGASLIMQAIVRLVNRLQ